MTDTQTTSKESLKVGAFCGPCPSTRRAVVIVAILIAALFASITGFLFLAPKQGAPNAPLINLLAFPSSPDTVSSGASRFTGGAKPVRDTTGNTGKEPLSVAAIGRLEPLDRIARISVPAFLKDERILRVLVKEGDWLRAGQVICIMDAELRLTKDLEQAARELDLARTRLAKVKAGAKQGELAAARAAISMLRAERQNKLAAQDAVIAKAGADLSFRRNEHERYKNLLSEGAVSSSQYDDKNTAMKSAQANLAEAHSERQRLDETLNARVDEAEANLNRVSEIRPVDIAIAEAELRQAEARRNKIALDLSLCRITSPQDGRVLKLNARVGETVADAGVVELGGTGRMMAVAEVYQSDVPRLHVGQRVLIEGDGMIRKARGRVIAIGWEVSKQSIYSQEPSAASDARVVEVKVLIDRDDNSLVEKFSNMQVECCFVAGGAK